MTQKPNKPGAISSNCVAQPSKVLNLQCCSWARLKPGPGTGPSTNYLARPCKAYTGPKLHPGRAKKPLWHMVKLPAWHADLAPAHHLAPGPGPGLPLVQAAPRGRFYYWGMCICWLVSCLRFVFLSYVGTPGMHPGVPTHVVLAILD